MDPSYAPSHSHDYLPRHENGYGHSEGYATAQSAQQPTGDMNPSRLSRAPSRASARSGKSRASSMSKSQSLIKKNIELQDLKPADILIERFMAWKAIVKQLCMYFEGIADIENNTAREMMKLSSLIQVPFRTGNQFLGEGGLQDVYYSIRDKSKTIADQHANLGRTIDSSIVQHLQKLLVEIKAHIRNVQNDTGKLAQSVAHERTTSTRLVGDLANAISTSKNTPLSLPPRSDPYIINTLVRTQLSRQVLEENLLQKSLVIMQHNSAHFEEGIVRSIKSAWTTFEEWRGRTQSVTSDMWSLPEQLMNGIDADREWIAFAARSDHLLDPETPLRDPELITYPLKDDPSTSSLHTGFLSVISKKSVVGVPGLKLGKKEWKEGWYVLTPSGYLHEFASSDTSTPAGQVPTFSLFLPNCTLGPATPANAAVHGFHIEASTPSSSALGASPSSISLDGGLGRSKSMKGGLKALLAPLGKRESTGASLSSSTSLNGLNGGGGGGKTKSWTFRARSHEEKMEWWNDLRMLCARYLVASEVVRRSGPVERTVRGVGYAEEDLYDSEEELEEEEELYHDAQAYQNPQRTYTREGQGIVYQGVEGEYDATPLSVSQPQPNEGHYQGLHSDGYTPHHGEERKGYTLHDSGPQPKSYAHHEQGGYYNNNEKSYEDAGEDGVVDLGRRESVSGEGKGKGVEYLTQDDAPQNLYAQPSLTA